MFKLTRIPFVILLFLLSSCFSEQQAFYLSPRHATSNYYKTIPLVSDSLQAGTYLSATVNAGGANHRLIDGNVSLQLNVHQSRTWRYLQGFYGAGLTTGLYDVAPIIFPGNGVNAVWINERAGTMFYGSYGAYGGLNYVYPWRSGGEWRVLGIEANMQQEFGRYQRFRKDVPLSGANVIERSNLYGGFTVYSDIIGRFSDGSTLGYKMAFSQSFRRLSGMLSNLEEVSAYPKYMSHTLHITRDQWTGYGQLNSGSDALNVQVGLVRRITERKSRICTGYINGFLK
jgi:hypothetical protein